MNQETKKPKTLFYVLAVIPAVLFGAIAAFLLARYLTLILAHAAPSLAAFTPSKAVIGALLSDKRGFSMFLEFWLALAIFCYMGFYFMIHGGSSKVNTSMQTITPKIEIPVSAGQGQYGTARFLDKPEYAKSFDSYVMEVRPNTEANAGYALPTLEGYGLDAFDDAENFRKTREKAGKEAPTDERLNGYDAGQSEEEESVNMIVPHTHTPGASKESDLRKANTWRRRKKIAAELPSSGGIVVGYEPAGGSKRKAKKETLYYLGGDMHTEILGTTRSGKTRGIILQSVCLTALAGESMILTDPKGELYEYLASFLAQLGFSVVCVNFKKPYKSAHYNFLQPVIDQIDAGEEDQAIQTVIELVASLVPETPRAEPLWRNGEMSMLSGAILSVAFDNLKAGRRELVNMTNVYHFINAMCRLKDGEMPLTRYVDGLPPEHPAKEIFGVALTASAKTRSSFVTSALAALQLFVNPMIYNMTRESDFKLEDTADPRRPRAVFIVLPDANNTYNALASLLIQQQYIALITMADERYGGRLPRRVNYFLDEFGNFPKIEIFVNMLSVGAGRGIRINFVLQSFSQLEDKYGKDAAEVVQDNVHCLIFLASNSEKTVASISKRLGKQTIAQLSQSSNVSSGHSTSSGSNQSFTGRDLLDTSQIQLIERPWRLVMLTGTYPAVMKIPDVSEWRFNAMLGMGDELHNRYLRMIRQLRDPDRPKVPFVYWDIDKLFPPEGSGIPVTKDAEAADGYPADLDDGDYADFDDESGGDTDAAERLQGMKAARDKAAMPDE